MFSVFRITKAEFAKVFKKPTVYIMAFILAIVLVIALLSYSPSNKIVNSVSIEGDNASKIYSVFNSESTINDTKIKIDNNYYNVANNQISFYLSIYNYKLDLSKKFETFQLDFNSLEKTYSLDANDAKIPELLSKSKKSMFDVIKSYENFEIYSKHDTLNQIVYAESINSLYIYETIYFDINEEKQIYNLNQLKNKCYDLNDITDAKLYISSINTNNFVNIFGNLTDCGQNIIYNILNTQLAELSLLQDKYINLVASSSKTKETKIEITNTINLLKDKNYQFKTLLDGLTSTNPVLALHTLKDYTKFTNAYDQFLNIYNKVIFDNNYEEFTSKKECAIALKNSSYLSIYQSYLNSIKFLNISEDYINTLLDYQKTVTKNQENILTNINALKNNTSTSEILDEINHYMLMGDSFVKIVDNKTTNQFSKNLSLSEMHDCKNIDLANYNEYNNKNTISTLKYQIDNNVFDNEVGDVFSLNKSISTKENMLDFTYYALKICTMLIIIFTIMMIANLITSETDSGTIKLLLIRPYRRGTILTGKILATFFFSLSFLLFSFIVCMTAGYFMFGAPTVDLVLVTFNASKTFLINPIWLLLIFLASCAGDILFYLIIALTVSVLFKSYIGAISTSLIIYVGAIVVSALLSSNAIYAYLPFTNVSWFRFFGGEIMPSKSGLGTLLSSPVHSFQNFYVSVGITVIFSTILLIITYSTFRRRDF